MATEWRSEVGRWKANDDLSSKITILEKKIDKYNERDDELLNYRRKLVKLYE